MARTLIVYGTTEGQTAKIARRLRDLLTADGITVELFDAREVPAGLQLTSYDGVILGASIHGGKYQDAIRDFAARHRTELSRMPAAFFSVSLSAAYPKAGDRARLDSYIARFFDEVGWHPGMRASFAGSLAYTHYGFFKRMVMRAIASRVPAPTDTSRDYEFTDWGAVERFAADFTDLVTGKPHAGPAPISAR